MSAQTELPDGLPADSSVTFLKQPPHSVAMEQAILGCVMLRPELLQTLQVTAEDFYRRDHRDIWNTLLELHGSDRAIDAVTVMDWSREKGDPELGSYVLEIAGGVYTPAGASTYAEKIIGYAIKRKAMDLANRINLDGMDDSVGPAELADMAAGAFAELSSESRITAEANDPVDLWGGYGVPEMSAAWLPQAISEYAFEQASLIGTSPSIIAMGCLVACASVTHDGIEIAPDSKNPSYREQARLWSLIVGDPSVKKTPAINAAVKHLRKMDYLDAETNIAKDADYDRQLKIYRKAEASYIKAEAAGAYSGDIPKPPAKPKKYRIVLQDATVEAMSDVLADNEGGVLYFKDEISGWFGGMDAYKKAGAGGMDRALWLETYNGGPRVVDRVSRGTIRVPNWSVCLIGGVQPDKMAGINAKTDDDGMLARFMPVVIRSDDRDSMDVEAKPCITERYYQILHNLRDTKPPQGDRHVTYEPAAEAIWKELRQWAKDFIRSNAIEGTLKNHLGKWEGLFNRLCLTYHCIGCAQMEDSHPCSVKIRKITAERVRDLMMKFLFPHALAFYHDTLGRSEEAKVSIAVGELILSRQSRSITRRDIVRNTSTFKNAPEWVQKRVLAYLIDGGWLIPMRPSERDPKAFRVNPKVFTRFARITPEAEAKRREIRERLQAAMASPSPKYNEK